MTTEGIEVRSIGNTLTLHESALVEAFNLKAAIQFEKNDSKSINTHMSVVIAIIVHGGFFFFSRQCQGSIN